VKGWLLSRPEEVEGDVTVQMADRLVNDHPRVKLDGFHPYRVIRGDIHARHGWGEPYPFATPPAPPDKSRCSALWRGYVATFRLHPDGSLELVGYEYMRSVGKWEPHPVGERLAGDFWLVLKRNFFGPRTYLPFRAGLVVEDGTEWVAEPETDLHRRLSRRRGGSS
jgi:hypothetical protein